MAGRLFPSPTDARLKLKDSCLHCGSKTSNVNANLEAVHPAFQTVVADEQEVDRK